MTEKVLKYWSLLDGHDQSEAKFFLASWPRCGRWSRQWGGWRRSKYYVEPFLNFLVMKVFNKIWKSTNYERNICLVWRFNFDAICLSFERILFVKLWIVFDYLKKRIGPTNVSANLATEKTWYLYEKRLFMFCIAFA